MDRDKPMGNRRNMFERQCPTEQGELQKTVESSSFEDSSGNYCRSTFIFFLPSISWSLSLCHLMTGESLGLGHLQCKTNEKHTTQVHLRSMNKQHTCSQANQHTMNNSALFPTFLLKSPHLSLYLGMGEVGQPHWVREPEETKTTDDRKEPRNNENQREESIQEQMERVCLPWESIALHYREWGCIHGLTYLNSVCQCCHGRSRKIKDPSLSLATFLWMK